MKRARRRGEGFSAEGTPASSRDFDAELLYKDDNDKKALEGLSEFQREAELARRYEEVARERQRAELLSNAKDRKDGRLEALSDIRARRARMKQLQSKASDISSNESGEEGEIEERETSEMEFSSDGEAPAAAEAEAPQMPPKTPDEPAELKPPLKKRPTGRAEDVGTSLFAEERLDFDEKRRKELSARMLEKLSLDLLNRVRLSTAMLIHIIEHPQAEAYLRGCFVKVAPPHAAANLRDAPPPDAFVCQIVGTRSCAEYSVKVGGSTRSCTYTLVLRPTPKASAKYDREFTLAELIDSPATQREFDNWVKKLKQFETVEDIAKKIKHKIVQLEQFTFTDEDVQQILLRKEAGASAASQTRGGLIKLAMSLKHQVDSVVATLSSTSTASGDRKELRENLNILLQKKAAAEAQLAKFKFDGVSSASQTPKRSPGGGGVGSRQGRGLLLAARRPAERHLTASAAPPRTESQSLGGLSGLCSLQSVMGDTREQQQRLVNSYLELGDTGASLAARIRPVSPPAAASHAPLLIPRPAKVELPPQCLVISLEEYKRQVAQLASMQLGG